MSLKALKPELAAFQGENLGARIRRRRHELKLDRIAAGKMLGASEATVMWWERDHAPVVGAYPAIIRFLGYEPWPKPQTLAEALLAERRRRGLSIKAAARSAGVDDGTWRKWERGEWKVTQVTRAALDQLLNVDTARAFRETRR